MGEVTELQPRDRHGNPRKSWGNVRVVIRSDGGAIRTSTGPYHGAASEVTQEASLAKTKGYQPGKRDRRRDGNITFAEDHEFHGAELNVWLSAPTELYLELVEMVNGELSQAETMQRFAPLIRRFAKSCLRSWNVLDDDGQAVAPDGDGLLAQDPEFVREILLAWMKEVAQPSAPLVEPSPDGSTPAAA